MDCPEVMGSCCIITEEEVAAANKCANILKEAVLTDVVSEMMKASGGLGTRWMTDRINNIVKECYIPDEWRKISLVPVRREKCKTNKPLIIFSSCDQFRRDTKQRQRSWVWMSGSSSQL